MKLKFTIAAKLGMGFGILTLAIVVNVILTSHTLSTNEAKNQEITSIYDPSKANLESLVDLIKNSRMLIRSWVFVDKKPETPDKISLVELHNTKFPELDSAITKISEKWSEEDRQEYLNISTTIKDTLFQKHEYIMNLLTSFESYDDFMIMFEVIPMVEEGGDINTITDNILSQLNVLVEKQQGIVVQAREEVAKSFANFRTLIILMGFILVIAAIVIGLITARSLTQPINRIKELLLKMGRGILPDNKIEESSDEIGQMSIALNTLIEGLKQISNFSVEIGKGNFKSDFKPLSDEDVLGNALLEMREELKKAAADEEKRKLEDAQRNWATQGMAMFGEILRKNNDNLEEFSYSIISNLVKYLEANQGGLFLVNDIDPKHVFIEMKACYAFDRRKFMEKQIELGEGLVGRCYQEGETIYMTEIPNNYVNITSGLGDDNPRSLLIVPLVLNDQIYGIIEMASFNELQKFEIEFVERIAESIASTVSTVKINMQTQMLLEQSRQQAEEMQSQEEEMRQNMEELRATQEQMERRDKELHQELEELRKKYNSLIESKDS